MRWRQSGELPLDYMLRVMRDPKVRVTRRDEMARSAASLLVEAIDLGARTHREVEERRRLPES
jgi:hypothetical protein